jgi:hypothetical protein
MARIDEEKAKREADSYRQYQEGLLEMRCLLVCVEKAQNMNDHPS